MKYVISFCFLLVSFSALAQSPLVDQLDQKAAAIEQKVIEWRRDFHQHPELGNEEVRTAGIVAQHLRSLGMEVEENVAVTGVVGLLKGGKPGPTVALRADMDGLPVTERADVPFKSQVTTIYNGQEIGVSHACGHDAHTSIGIAVATLMGELFVKTTIQGTVKFIFQPAEENTDANGKTGSPYLIEAGVLKDIDAIVALHMNPEREVGTVFIHDGYSMANVDVFQATIHGSGGHGAYPHLGTDPIWMLGPVLQALHGIVARNISPLDAAVISVGEVKGGSASNIIPTEVFLNLFPIKALVRFFIVFKVVITTFCKYRFHIHHPSPLICNRFQFTKYSCLLKTYATSTKFI